MKKYRVKKRVKKNRKKAQILIVLSITMLSLIGFGIEKVFFNKSQQSKIVQAKVIENKEIDIPKETNVTAEGDKYTENRKDVEQMINGKYPRDSKKIVFLTFDDGPNIKTTGDILDILKSKNVKATFFIVGANLQKSSKNQQLLMRELTDGHAIGNHTFTHNTKKLYPGNKVDVTEFMNEMHQDNEIMKNILGDNFNSKIVRMPGGYMSRKIYKDPNLNELDSAFEQEGFNSIDWNAEDGDAEGKSFSNEEMMNLVKSTSKNKEKVILLMHDTKPKTKEILPNIIDYFKSQGYEFKTIQ